MIPFLFLICIISEGRVSGRGEERGEKKGGTIQQGHNVFDLVDVVNIQLVSDHECINRRVI